ncbi:MAG: MFS transporter [Oscillospiraceae bacterium]|nr:MFS transporter [Oscillospiraceae bacterium]
MAKISAEIKDQVKQAVSHPVDWWKGAGLPEEKLRPWENGIQFFSELLRDPMNGFQSMQGRLFTGVGGSKVSPIMKSVSDIIKTVWDGLNDPPIGMYMDRKNFGEKVYRWIMRVSATLVPLLILAQCFDLGLTPLQRAIQWTVMGIVIDVFETANGISDTKIWAGITPHSEQRGQLQLWRTMGDNFGNLVSGIPMTLMGLTRTMGWDFSDYKIMIWGAAIFAPLTILSRWLPSFAKQRIDFTQKIAAGETEGEEPQEEKLQEEKPLEEKLSLRESFSIVKYNRWFMMWLVIDFIRLLCPSTDRMFIYQYLIPSKRIFGKEIDGLLVKKIGDIGFKWPALALLPFAAKAVEKFGGPVNFIRGHIIVILVTKLASFFVGYNTWPRLVFMWISEMFWEIMGKWSSVPHTMIRFEMFDYVEWKTGYRSEGITQSVDGLLKKLIKDSAGNFIGGAVTQWTGWRGWEYDETQQPERFLKTIWPLLHIGPILGEAVALVALLWFKYPHDPKEVEADLIARRAMAQKIMDEAEL